MPLATKPKPPAHHKKVSGRHHKATKSYLKTYWPYLPLAAIVGIGLMINAVLAAPGSVLGTSSDYTSTSFLSDTNADRSAAGETPLKLNAELSAAAQAKADDMVARNYWSHDTPDGQAPWSFIQRTGYRYTTAGENLAYGFSGAATVLSAWMNSPEHRANILNATYQDVGFGVASSRDFNNNGPATVVVAMYGSRQASTSTQPELIGAAQSRQVAGATTAPPMKPVARITLLAGSRATWSSLAAACAGSVAAIIFVARHARAWRKLLVKGEDFILEHIWIDMFIVGIAMSSYLLVQNVGLIG